MSDRPASRWKSFKRPRSPPRDGKNSVVAPPTEAAALVARHYNKRANTQRTTAGGASIMGLRNLNNFIKSVILGQHLSPNCSVLDFACGKGGDMLKFRNGNIGHYVGIDIAHGSVVDAVHRYNADASNGRFPPMPFTARFLSGDCFGVDLSAHLPPALRFDCVSCQFALHYAFETEARARQALRNAASRLPPGAHFVGTIPDASVLCSKLKAAPGPEFGNDHYKVVFDDHLADGAFLEAVDHGDSSAVFGLRYRFTLEDAVTDCPEYLVFRKVLAKLGQDVGLKLVRYENFHPFFQKEWPRYHDLMRRMRVLPDPEHRIPEAEWEVAYLYAVFVFEKMPDPDTPRGPRVKAMHPGRPQHTRVDPAQIVQCTPIAGL